MTGVVASFGIFSCYFKDQQIYSVLTRGLTSHATQALPYAKKTTKEAKQR